MSDAISTKKCKICASQIPADSKKCIHCGEYQSRWRYLHVSQLTMALLVAILAVGSQAFSWGGGLIKSLQQWTLGDNEKLQIARIEVDITEASFAVYNRSSEPVFVTGVSCVLSPLIDPIQWSASSIVEVTDEGVTVLEEDKKVLDSDIISGFSASYKTDRPFLLKPGEDAVLDFHIDLLAYIGGVRGSVAEENNVCALGGVGREQVNILTEINFSADEIFNYDIVSAMSHAVMPADLRAEMLKKVQDVRKENAKFMLKDRMMSENLGALLNSPYYNPIGADEHR